MASNVLCPSLSTLSEPSKSTLMTMLLSMYMCLVPFASTGMWPITSFPSTKGDEGDKNLGSVTSFQVDALRVLGFKVLSCKITRDRSLSESEITPHSYDPGAPPKISHRATMTRFLTGTCCLVLVCIFGWMALNSSGISCKLTCSLCLMLGCVFLGTLLSL